MPGCRRPTTAQPNIAGNVLIDPNSASLTGPARKARVFYHIKTRGLYQSDDGGVTFTLKGGPVGEVSSMQMGLPGFVWMVDCDNKLLVQYDIALGTFTNVNAGTTIMAREIRQIEVYPQDRNVMMLQSEGGESSLTENAGVSWTDHDWLRSVTWTDPDIPAMPPATTGLYIALGSWKWSKITAGQMLLTMGKGCWLTTITAATYAGAWTFTGKSNGIEQLVAQSIKASPNGKVFVTVHDRTMVRVINGDLQPAADKFAMLNFLEEISHGQTISVVEANPNLMAAAVVRPDPQWGAGRPAGSRYSDDGGESWNLFATMPADWATTPPVGLRLTPQDGGGCLERMSDQHFVWVPMWTEHWRPYRTANKGANWTELVLPGVPLTNDGSGSWNDIRNLGGAIGSQNYTLRRKVVAIDPLIPGKAWIAHPGNTVGGIFETTDYFASMAQVAVDPHVMDGDGYNFKMLPVFDRSNHLWITAGDQGDFDGPGASGPLRRSSNGGRNWSDMPGVSEAKSFAFGKAAPGESHPALYLAGFVDPGSGTEFGMYYCVDPLATNPTFYRTAENILERVDGIVEVEASRTIFGEHYIGFGGSGFAMSRGAPIGTQVLRAPL